MLICGYRVRVLGRMAHKGLKSLIIMACCLLTFDTGHFLQAQSQLCPCFVGLLGLDLMDFQYLVGLIPSLPQHCLWIMSEP